MWHSFTVQAPNDGFLLNTLEITFKRAIQSTFRSLEIHSRRRYEICICSVILGEFESFRNYNACASVDSNCAQSPLGYRGAFARLFNPGGGAFANFALPGGRVLVNPGLFPSFLSKRLAKDHCKISKLKQNTLRRLTKFSPYLRKNKNALSSVESRLLENKCCCQRRRCCYTTFSFGIQNECLICHNVTTQNVKIARRDRPLILDSNRSGKIWKPSTYWYCSSENSFRDFTLKTLNDDFYHCQEPMTLSA